MPRPATHSTGAEVARLSRLIKLTGAFERQSPVDKEKAKAGALTAPAFGRSVLPNYYFLVRGK
jgi:hypothetical protein